MTKGTMTAVRHRTTANFASADRSARAGLLQRKHACGKHTLPGCECPACREDGQFGLQSKPSVGEPRVLAVSGMPLQQDLRHHMEQRSGHDFSRVRVHADATAARSARDVDTSAYPFGCDVLFGAGRFAPGTQSGQRPIGSMTRAPGLLQRKPNDPTTSGKTLRSEGVDLNDPVAARTATLIDAALARNRKLAPYIGDRIEHGFRIAEKGKFIQDSTDGNFDDAYRKAYELSSSDYVSKDTNGFYDPKRSQIHLRPNAEFGTALHESIHRLASPALYKHYLPLANKVSTNLTAVLKEGVTAFFTDCILKDEELPNFNDAYRSQKNKAERMIGALGTGGFDLIATFNFKGTGVIEIGEKLGYTKKQFGAAKGNGTTEVLKLLDKKI